MSEHSSTPSTEQQEKSTGTESKTPPMSLEGELTQLQQNLAVMGRIAQKGLEAIVLDFNQALSMWSQLTTCRANFNWRYHDDSKQLYIVDVVYPVFSKREITDTDVQSALAKFSSTQPAE